LAAPDFQGRPACIAIAGQQPVTQEGTMNAFAANPDQHFDNASHHTPVAIQILSMIFFMAFAIVSTVLAFTWFWPAGFALAVIFAIRGFGPFGGERHAARRHQLNMMALRPHVGSSQVPMSARPRRRC
jgi:hypothetical protein